jgi:hypothetical protein
MDTTGHQRLFLFRGVRTGFGFSGGGHPGCFAGFGLCAERIPADAELGGLGGGTSNSSIIMAVLICEAYAWKPNKRAGVDAEFAPLFAFVCPRLGTTQRGCSL